MSPQFAPKKRTAFTLVELLVVIGIIAILIALVVTVIPKVKKAAYGAATSAQLSAISNAIQQYYGDFKAYPGPLANNQLGIAYDPQGNSSTPNAAGFALTGTNNISFSDLKHITGAQNLVLGLLGGLELKTTTGVNGPIVSAFVYNPLDIFPDGKHPGPVGASTLSSNLSNIRRQQSYIQVRDGDLSVPSMAAIGSVDSYNNKGTNGHSFIDSASRTPTDAPIPVFLDKYPDPLPVLYIRTNVGAKAVVGVRNTDGSAQLIDPASASGAPESPQFDLCQLLDYTLGMTGTGGIPWVGKFGTINTSKTPYHGLEALGNTSLNPSGTIDTIASGYANQGANAFAYFRDPNFVANANGSYNTQASNTFAGVAREKDGFLLITAGPDRAYGTTDDIIFPGTLMVAQ